MRLWWILLLCFLIVSGTVKARRTPRDTTKDGDKEDKDDNGKGSGDDNDGKDDNGDKTDDDNKDNDNDKDDDDGDDDDEDNADEDDADGAAYLIPIAPIVFFATTAALRVIG